MTLFTSMQVTAVTFLLANQKGLIPNPSLSTMLQNSLPSDDYTYLSQIDITRNKK